MFELQWAALGTSLCEWQMHGCADTVGFLWGPLERVLNGISLVQVS